MSGKYLLRFAQLTALFLLTINAFSQSEYDKPEGNVPNHSGGEFVVSVSPNLLFSESGAKLAGGLKIQFFISKRISLDADIVASKNYLHLSPGLIGVPLGLLMLSDAESEKTLNEMLLSIAGIALSIEHVSYHIPVNQMTDVAPFVSLLRYRRSSINGITAEQGDLSSKIKDQLCFVAGLQVNKLFGKFVISPYAEYSISYKDRSSAFSLGLYCGYRFNR